MMIKLAIKDKGSVDQSHSSTFCCFLINSGSINELAHVLITQAISEGSGERICAVSPEPSLFAHMKYGSRWRVRPKHQTSSPTWWLHLRVWRISLRRTKSTIILWAGSIGPRQANLVLIAYASSEGSCEPAHPRSLARTFAARSYKQWIKRNLQTESQIPGPSEWLGMRS